jgi:tRNA(adenine34) deaminase
MLCIREASRKLANERLIGTTLYVTLEPCTMCAGAISFARIARLVYGAKDPKGGAIEHGAKFFASPTCHHRPEVTTGIRWEEAASLLKAFFKARR